MQTQTIPTKRELVITRILDAPRELVWKAWTEPELMMQWWAPKNFTAPSIKLDLRVGGEYLSCMRSPEGKDYWSKGTYKEIVPGQRLVLTNSFADEKGNIVPATYYGMSPEFPLESIVTVTLDENGGRTKLTLRYDDVSSIPQSDLSDMQQGWNEMLDKLADFLKKGG
jgi:uncharacterized protein YndB with AHSA1/START domain